MGHWRHGGGGANPRPRAPAIERPGSHPLDIYARIYVYIHAPSHPASLYSISPSSRRYIALSPSLRPPALYLYTSMYASVGFHPPCACIFQRELRVLRPCGCACLSSGGREREIKWIERKKRRVLALYGTVYGKKSREARAIRWKLRRVFSAGHRRSHVAKD